MDKWGEGAVSVCVCEEGGHALYNCLPVICSVISLDSIIQYVQDSIPTGVFEQSGCRTSLWMVVTP